MDSRESKGLSAAAATLHLGLIAGIVLACVAIGRRLNAEMPVGLEVAYALGQSALLYTPVHLLSVTLNRPGASRSGWRSALPILLMSSLLVLLVANLATLRFVGIVITSNVISLASEPGFFLTIGARAIDWVMLAGAFVAMSLVLALLGALLERWAAGPIAGFRSALVILSVGLASQLCFAVHAVANPEAAQSVARHVPLMPETSLPALAGVLGIEGPPAEPLADGSLGLVKRPADIDKTGYLPGVELPERLQAEEDFSVLYIIAESLRYDMMLPSIMPTLTELAKDPNSFRSPHHYSTGNATGPGLWGIFAGLSPLYWADSRVHEAYPLVFEVYERLGYHTTLYYTSSLQYTEIDKYVFPLDRLNVKSFARRKQGISWRMRSVAEDDVEAVDQLTRDWREEPAEKRVDIIYLWATHYNYYYAEEDAKFQPVLPQEFEIYELALLTEFDQLKNRYKNASRHTDRMLARILDGLRTSNRLDRTIVVFLGDHGEEFRERHHIGHSTALNRFQTEVPLVIRSPKKLRSLFSISSHSDLTPTILGNLGVDMPFEPFFTGKDLARYDPDRNDALIFSFYRKMLPQSFVLVRDKHKAGFRNTTHGLRASEFLDLRDQPVTFSRERAREFTNRVQQLWTHFER